MSSDSKKEIGVGIFFLVFAIAYMAGASTISTFTPFGNRGLDSRSVPELLGILTIILSMTHLAQVFLKERKLKRIRKDNKTNDEEVCSFKDDICVVSQKETVLSRIDSVMPIKLVISLIFLLFTLLFISPLDLSFLASFF